ncbi:hypothetical protein CR152_05900 [Massilia violaceinigra]|uniref:Glucose/Sorbosone dehydrogenase domain-containing protein n=1 Tax=Massilia violaceinigra TaxID=2045208 RepID=A0A2D2DUU6_9BURK|nr:hypothetical protein CR152_05900 [Massilia violaceinigra]
MRNLPTWARATPSTRRARAHASTGPRCWRRRATRSRKHGPVRLTPGSVYCMVAHTYINWRLAGRNDGWPNVAAYKDNAGYAYANYSAAEGGCEGVKDPARNGTSVPPGVPVQRESAWTDPDFVEPLKTFYTVDSSFSFKDPVCAENSLYYICWPTVAPSSVTYYKGGGKAGVPGWEHSLLIGSLKRGIVYRVRLDPNGHLPLGDAEPLFRSVNRSRDIVVSADGATIYVATDIEGSLGTSDSGAPTKNLEIRARSWRSNSAAPNRPPLLPHRPLSPARRPALVAEAIVAYALRKNPLQPFLVARAEAGGLRIGAVRERRRHRFQLALEDIALDRLAGHHARTCMHRKGCAAGAFRLLIQHAVPDRCAGRDRGAAGVKTAVGKLRGRGPRAQVAVQHPQRIDDVRRLVRCGRRQPDHLVLRRRAIGVEQARAHRKGLAHVVHVEHRLQVRPHIDHRNVQPLPGEHVAGRIGRAHGRQVCRAPWRGLAGRVAAGGAALHVARVERVGGRIPHDELRRLFPAADAGIDAQEFIRADLPRRQRAKSVLHADVVDRGWRKAGAVGAVDIGQVVPVRPFDLGEDVRRIAVILRHQVIARVFVDGIDHGRHRALPAVDALGRSRLVGQGIDHRIAGIAALDQGAPGPRLPRRGGIERHLVAEVLLQQRAVGHGNRLRDHVRIRLHRNAGIQQSGPVLREQILLHRPARAADADREGRLADRLDEAFLGHRGRFFRQAHVVMHARFVAGRIDHRIPLRQHPGNDLALDAAHAAAEPDRGALLMADADAAAQPVHQLAVPGRGIEARRRIRRSGKRRQHGDGVRKAVDGAGFDPHHERHAGAMEGDGFQVGRRRGVALDGVERLEPLAGVVKVVNLRFDGAVPAVPEQAPARRGAVRRLEHRMADAVLVIHQRLAQARLLGAAHKRLLLRTAEHGTGHRVVGQRQRGRHLPAAMIGITHFQRIAAVGQARHHAFHARAGGGHRRIDALAIEPESHLAGHVGGRADGNAGIAAGHFIRLARQHGERDLPVRQMHRAAASGQYDCRERASGCWVPSCHGDCLRVIERDRPVFNLALRCLNSLDHSQLPEASTDAFGTLSQHH